MQRHFRVMVVRAAECLLTTLSCLISNKNGSHFAPSSLVNLCMKKAAAPPVTYFRRRRTGPEARLEDVVARELRNVLPAGNSRRWTAGSIPIGAGLPDLLVVSYQDALLALSSVNFSEAEILAYLRVVKKATPNAIATSTRRSLRSITKALNQLEQMAAVAKASRSSFRLTAEWKSILPEIVAIEVKVTNWRRAICQASRNRIFTHQSYVALPIETGKRVRRLPVITQLGLGVLGVEAAGKVRLLRRAKRTRPLVWSYYYEIASLAARHLVRPKDAFHSPN